MVSIDSNKMTFPREVITKFDSRSFNENENRDGKTGEISTFRLLRPDSKQLGLKYISIGENKVVVETSAKFLKEHYLEGLTENTFEYFAHQLNNSGVISIDENMLIDEAIFQKIDVTSNIYPSDVKKSLRDLQIYSSHHKYKLEPYRTGFAITHKAKTKKERISAYTKYDELSKKTKVNRELLEYISLNDTKGILRFETNLKGYERIRDAFQLPKQQNNFPVKDILRSKEKPNYKGYSKVFDIDKPLKNRGKCIMSSLIDEGYTQRQLEKELGMRQIIVNCNYDIEIVRNVLESTTKGNISRYIRNYKDLIDSMKYEKLNYDVSTLKEIKELLKVA